MRQRQKEQHASPAARQQQLFLREHFTQLQLGTSSSSEGEILHTDFGIRLSFSILYPNRSGSKGLVSPCKQLF